MSNENEVFVGQFDMKVAAKVIQLVSTGIYRTPANAMKELISNAFDADAPTVKINFDNQNFEKVTSITIEDNGKGINSGDFQFSMTHIGSSLKRIEGEFTESGRPIIVRIGIGLLSVGQATNKFEIISAIQNGTGMRAEIDLSAYFDAIKMTESLDDLKIGNIKLFTFEDQSKRTYTKMILKDLKKPFLRALFGKLNGAKEFKFNHHNTYLDFINWLDENEIKRLD